MEEGGTVKIPQLRTHSKFGASLGYTRGMQHYFKFSEILDVKVLTELSMVVHAYHINNCGGRGRDQPGSHSKFQARRGWRGVQHSDRSCRGPRGLQFPAPAWQLTTSSNSSDRTSNIVFWPPWAPALLFTHPPTETQIHNLDKKVNKQIFYQVRWNTWRAEAGGISVSSRPAKTTQ